MATKEASLETQLPSSEAEARKRNHFASSSVVAGWNISPEPLAQKTLSWILRIRLDFIAFCPCLQFTIPS